MNRGIQKAEPSGRLVGDLPKTSSWPRKSALQIPLVVSYGKYQFVQDMIADRVLGYETSKLLVMQAAFMKDRGIRNTRETSLAKWHATEHAVQAALDAIQVHGAYGYSNEYPVERYLRNAKAAVIYEGTSQLHTLIQADYLLGYRRDKPLKHPALMAQSYAQDAKLAVPARPGHTRLSMAAAVSGGELSRTARWPVSSRYSRTGSSPRARRY